MISGHGVHISCTISLQVLENLSVQMDERMRENPLKSQRICWYFEAFYWVVAVRCRSADFFRIHFYFHIETEVEWIFNQRKCVEILNAYNWFADVPSSSRRNFVKFPRIREGAPAFHKITTWIINGANTIGDRQIKTNSGTFELYIADKTDKFGKRNELKIKFLFALKEAVFCGL